MTKAENLTITINSQKLISLVKCLIQSEDEYELFNDYFYHDQRSDLFISLCNYRDHKRQQQTRSLDQFIQLTNDVGLAAACNSVYYSGLTPAESKLLDRKYGRSSATVDDVFYQLESNIERNPLQFLFIDRYDDKCN